MTKQTKYLIAGSIVVLLLITVPVMSAAESLIKSFEGEYLDAYLDPVGIPTIGYGTIYNYDAKRPVQLGDKIDKDTAIRFLRTECAKIIPQIKKLVRVPINQNQLDALTSFVYNVGIGALRNSTLLKLLNEGKPKTEVAEQFLRWNKATNPQGILITLPGLTRRRKAEKELFLA
jgi:lysozyme